VINVDVRVISATHRDLRELAARGGFREDLFYRLNVLRLELPPLRERREDIPLLASHFLRRTAQRNEHAPKELQPEAIERLLQHSFPGNVRELQNVIERACALEPGPSIGPARLNLDARQAEPSASPAYHKTFQFKGVALNRRQQQLLDHLRSGVAAITNREYCGLVGVSERTGLRDLSHLVEGGLLQRIGKRKGARYQLNPSALEH
jgi:DNA-binding NtrC family response regulator